MLFCVSVTIIPLYSGKLSEEVPLPLSLHINSYILEMKKRGKKKKKSWFFYYFAYPLPANQLELEHQSFKLFFLRQQTTSFLKAFDLRRGFISVSILNGIC